jgi:4-amino-4-deoxy-L-arabinose transferase-like glycosyltransferase
VQKQQLWPFALLGIIALCCTFLGIFLAFANNIEEPPHDGELLAIGTVALCNLLWFVPWTIIQHGRGDRNKVLAGLALFIACWIHFPYRYLVDPAFDAEVWIASTDHTYSYDGKPAHRAGYMVPHIIQSELCVGRTLAQIEVILGTAHFDHRFPYQAPQKTYLAYFYSNKVLFDGCDKLLLCFENGICTSAGYGGCD